MEYESIPLHWAHRLSFVSRRAMGEMFAAAGLKLSAEEWAVMMMLNARDGQGTGELAARSIRDKTTMTRLIDTLVAKRLVERRGDPADRRRVTVWLAPGGRAAWPRLEAVARDLLAQALEGVTPQEAEAASRVLRRMTENLTRG